MPSRNVCVTASCGACGRQLPAGRARRWCSDACRQAAFRRRHRSQPATAELPAGADRKPATVYECPQCGGRLLGEQRCEECSTFMRRLGFGGLCPGCDEPLTIDELLGNLT
jgi:hypothetical protein